MEFMQWNFVHTKTPKKRGLGFMEKMHARTSLFAFHERKKTIMFRS